MPTVAVDMMVARDGLPQLVHFLKQLGQGQGLFADQVLAEPRPRLVVAVLGVLNGTGGNVPPVLNADLCRHGLEVVLLNRPLGSSRATGVAFLVQVLGHGRGGSV
jgi:hypothetical protein